MGGLGIKKKGVELSINTIVIIILLLIVLVILVLILTGAMKDISSSIWTKIKNALGLWNASQVKPLQ
ncbi:MAG: hypothetical protein NZ889_00285 [Candidatus Pacearchaeota archaeon]|nr:hypothetical protein [Candidatus Pacearchaeota archaeon]